MITASGIYKIIKEDVCGSCPKCDDNHKVRCETMYWRQAEKIIAFIKERDSKNMKDKFDEIRESVNILQALLGSVDGHVMYEVFIQDILKNVDKAERTYDEIIKEYKYPN